MKFEIDCNHADIERLKYLCNLAGSYKLEKQLSEAQAKNAYEPVPEKPIFPPISETLLVLLNSAVVTHNGNSQQIESRIDNNKRIMRDVNASTSLPQKEIDFIQTFVKQETSFAQSIRAKIMNREKHVMQLLTVARSGNIPDLK